MIVSTAQDCCRLYTNKPTHIKRLVYTKHYTIETLLSEARVTLETKRSILKGQISKGGGTKIQVLRDVTSEAKLLLC